MSGFNDGDRVTWTGKQVEHQFYGTLVTRPAPGIWIVRFNGGGCIDVTEDRLTKVVNR
jgi:hypothetical protein